MSIHATDRGWVLETRTGGYAIGLDDAGLLVHRYWGGRLPRVEDYPPVETTRHYHCGGPPQQTREEYPTYGDIKFVEPCLQTTFADGVRDTVLRFQSSDIVTRSSGAEGTPELRLHLRDAHYPLKVTLHYRVHADYDLIERFVSLTNTGDAPITLGRVWSAMWHFPGTEPFRLTHMTGRWNDEMNLRRETVLEGKRVLESRRIIPSHQHNPYFAIDRGNADENQGEVWFGVLAWSGNWKLVAEMTDFCHTRIGIGLNDWDFAWKLEHGETFISPSSYAGYTDAGYGSASHRFHDFIRDTVLPHGKEVHPVLYNSWEATMFNVDEPSQSALAEVAAKMGVELFVVDDGWFHGRNSDRAGLGDWWCDAKKFPRGLRPLIDRVKNLGMQFGLWVEPEMVNPDSELYRAHPDWVLHFPTRKRNETRNQLILNFARTDVQDYIIGVLDRLLRDNDISFIKWDMNRPASEAGWPSAEREPREVWVRYVEGLYRVWGTLRERHPDVVWQSCASGGGRADFRILRLADQIWISDNTEAPARLQIQEGYSNIFPANTMEAWVTDQGRGTIPLEFRFHVSMCGTLGVGGHLLEWTEAERDEAARCISLYKEIRHVVQYGDLYRLRSPHAHPFSAVQYVSKNRTESVLFAFRTHLPRPAELPPLLLRGLDPQALYTVEGVEGVRSGEALMRAGVRVELKDFQSTVRRIRRTD